MLTIVHKDMNVMSMRNAIILKPTIHANVKRDFRVMDRIVLVGEHFQKFCAIEFLI